MPLKKKQRKDQTCVSLFTYNSAWRGLLGRVRGCRHAADQQQEEQLEDVHGAAGTDSPDHTSEQHMNVGRMLYM